MPLPATVNRVRLLSPATMTVEAIDRAATLQDTRSREPVGNVVRTTFTIEAQRTNVHRQVPVFTQYGVDEQVRAWFTIRKEDADRIGYTPRRGDRVVKFGSLVTELYIVNTEPIAHYEGGHNAWRLYASDRRPAANRPNKG